MNLEQAIHERWAASPGLEALLPARRVRTGAFHGEGRPYATLERKSSRTAFRTNAGDALEKATLAIHVWHDGFDAGLAIVREIRAAFDHCSFSLDGGRAVRIHRIADAARQHENNVWQFTVEFSASVYLLSGT